MENQPPTVPAPIASANDNRFSARGGSAFGRGGQRGGGRPGGRGPRAEKPKSEFDQKMIDIRRVTRVVRGGRRFSFSIVLVAGNRRGKVGVGVGKASDVSQAMDKAFRDAKKNMVELKLTKEFSLPHETFAKYASSKVTLRPAPGRGLAAGSSARVILNLAGVKDVSAKINSKSKNKLNNARATMEALVALGA